ncbi:hypothetical protein ACS0TY_006701 [Phlomoides rotata]
MSQSSQSSETTTCYCGLFPVTVTSWKNENVGRRFLGCKRYPMDGYCTFFKWVDTPLCDRAKQIIPGLLRRINEQKATIQNLEFELVKLEEKSRKMQSVICSLEEEIRSLKTEMKTKEEIKTEEEIRSLKKLKPCVKMVKTVVVCWACWYLIMMGFNLISHGSRAEYRMIN